MQDVSISFVNQRDIFGTSHLVILWNLSDLETLRPSHHSVEGNLCYSTGVVVAAILQYSTSNSCSLFAFSAPCKVLILA